MKAFLLILFFGAIASFSKASPQGFLVLDHDGSEEAKPTSPKTPPRPYAPLPPMYLPPHFQNLGISLPPPPSPPLQSLQTLENTPLQHLQLGQADERFLFNYLAQLKPILFPWLRTTTTTSTTTAPTTTEVTTEEPADDGVPDADDEEEEVEEEEEEVEES